MTITKIARIPLKVPMMLPQPAAGSVSPCVVFAHTAGVAGDVVGVVKTVVTITPAKRYYQLIHYDCG